MSDDLITRLRATADGAKDGPIMREAADALEALERQLGQTADLQSELTAAKDYAHEISETCEALEAGKAALEEKLAEANDHLKVAEFALCRHVEKHATLEADNAALREKLAGADHMVAWLNEPFSVGCDPQIEIIRQSDGCFDSFSKKTSRTWREAYRHAEATAANARIAALESQEPWQVKAWETLFVYITEEADAEKATDPQVHGWIRCACEVRRRMRDLIPLSKPPVTGHFFVSRKSDGEQDVAYLYVDAHQKQRIGCARSHGPYSIDDFDILGPVPTFAAGGSWGD